MIGDRSGYRFQHFPARFRTAEAILPALSSMPVILMGMTLISCSSSSTRPAPLRDADAIDVPADDPYREMLEMIAVIPESVRGSLEFEAESRVEGCVVMKRDGLGHMPEPIHQAAIIEGLVTGRDGLYVFDTRTRAPVSTDIVPAFTEPELDIDAIARCARDAGLATTMVDAPHYRVMVVGRMDPWKMEVIDFLRAH